MLRGVLFLSRLLGRDVLVDGGIDGAVVARLADLTVRLDDTGGPQRVERLLVSRRGAAAELISWDAVRRFEAGRPVLAAEAASAPLADLGDNEILLGRDVLDTQVVDVAGQRLARVADVVLALTSHTRLEVVGVEVSFSAVLRRLGLQRLIPNRADDVVAWGDLHLTSERGHAVQLAAPRAAVHRLDARGLAALVSRVDTDSASEILARKEPDVAAKVVVEAHPEVGERMLRALPEPQADRIVAAMPAAHAKRWRDRLHRPGLHGRRFLRSAVSRRPHLNWRRP